MSLTVATKFAAVDKFTATVKKMETATARFANKAKTKFKALTKNVRGLGRGLAGLGMQIAAMSLAMVAFNANLELEKNLASLSAITGATGKKLDLFKTQIELVSKSQKKFAGDTAKAFEIVGSAQPELLGNAEALGKVTEAAMILSKASGDDLAQSALSVTGVMNQFSLGADQATRVINTLAAGAKVGSANIPRIADAMTNFGAVASSANITLEQSVALIEVMGKKSIYGSEAGNKLKGSILKLQKAGVGYASGQFNINDALTEAKMKIDQLGTAQEKDAAILKMFGAENITTGQILLNNIGLFEEYTKGVTGTDEANVQASINSSTLSMKMQELSAAFKNATTSTNSNNVALTAVKSVVGFLADNMNTLIGVVGILGGAFLLYKAIMIGYQVVMGIATAVQWAFGAALNFGLLPLLLIIGAIVAVIAVIKNWSKIVSWFKKQWDKFWIPLKEGIDILVKIFKNLWQKIKVIWKKLTGWISKLWDKAWGFVKRQAMLLIKVFVTVRDFIVKIWDSVTGWISDKWDKLWSGATRIFRKFVGFFRRIVAKIKEIWQDIVAWIENGFNSIAKKMLKLQSKFIGGKQADKVLKIIEMGEQAKAGQQVTPEQFSQVLNPDAAKVAATTQNINKTIDSKTRNELLIKDQTGNAVMTKRNTPNIALSKTTGI